MNIDDYFAAVIGHGNLKNHFKQLLEKKYLPHAMLFSGDAGMGKTTMAMALASAVVGRIVNFDGTEKTAVLLQQDRDDVFYIRPVGKMLKVEQFRQLQEQLMLRSRNEEPRICIIDEVQTMNKEFANRMLKTLEEPPVSVYFILITTQLNLVLPTILSRCTLSRFLPIAPSDLTAELIRVRGIVDDAACQSAVLLGNGNVQQTLMFFEQGTAVELEAALRFLQCMTESRCPYAVWLVAMQEGVDGTGTAVFQWLMQLCRDMLVLRIGRTEQLRLRQYQAQLVALRPHWSERVLLQAIGLFEEAIEAINRNLNRKLVWDQVCIQLMKMLEEEKSVDCCRNSL
jgi:DNA polymerase-3 subunit delta'